MEIKSTIHIADNSNGFTYYSYLTPEQMYEKVANCLNNKTAFLDVKERFFTFVIIPYEVLKNCKITINEHVPFEI